MQVIWWLYYSMIVIKMQMQKLPYKLFEQQISGRQPKLVTSDLKFILKGYDHKQHQFYQYVQSLTTQNPLYALNQFIPLYKKTITLQHRLKEYLQSTPTKQLDSNTDYWLKYLKRKVIKVKNDKEFMMLQNISQKYNNPNILDIKIGGREIKDNKLSRWERSQYYFLIHGFRINFNSGQNLQNSQNQTQSQTIFLSKYSFLQLIKTTQDTIDHLALFFFDGKQIRQCILTKIIEKLKNFILVMKAFHSWKIYSSSICIFYDTEDNGDIVDLKFLDFSRNVFTGSYQVEDDSILIGLENVHRFFVEILAQREDKKFIERILQLKEKYLRQKVLLVPQDKQEAYKDTV